MADRRVSSPNVQVQDQALQASTMASTTAQANSSTNAPAPHDSSITTQTQHQALSGSVQAPQGSSSFSHGTQCPPATMVSPTTSQAPQGSSSSSPGIQSPQGSSPGIQSPQGSPSDTQSPKVSSSGTQNGSLPGIQQQPPQDPTPGIQQAPQDPPIPPQPLWKYPELFTSLVRGDLRSFCTNRLTHIPNPPAQTQGISNLKGLLVHDHVTSNRDMAIHVMIAKGRWNDVLNGLALPTLNNKNDMGYTPFCLAAAVGNLKAVTNLLELYEGLINIDITDAYATEKPRVAIVEAARRGHVAIVEKLLPGILAKIELLKDNMPGSIGSRPLVCDFLEALIESDSYGVLLDLLNKVDFAWVDFEEKTVLWLIMNNASVGQHHKAVQTVKFLCDKLLDKEDDSANIRIALVKPVILAVKRGLIRILVAIINRVPAAVCFVDEGISLFHVAVLHRQQDVFNLVYELSSYKHMLVACTDIKNNNLLHMAGKLPDPDMPEEIVNPALKMQRELQWFKEVESILPTIFRTKKNADGKTPWAVFTEEHKGLAEEGEKWIREACQASTVVAALISAVGLAASITVPGGYASNGFPVHRNDSDFALFYIINTVSM